MICPKCENYLPDNMQFCNSCGTPLVSQPKPQSYVPQQQVYPADSQSPSSKSKIGISVALLAAATYFIALVGGWIPAILVAGYILLVETDRFAKEAAVKSLVTLTFFGVLIAIINFVPSLSNILNDVCGLFKQDFSLPSALTNFLSIITSVLSVTQKILLILLGFNALSMNTTRFPFIDELIDKHK